jgi:hypothetical protein
LNSRDEEGAVAIGDGPDTSLDKNRDREVSCDEGSASTARFVSPFDVALHFVGVEVDRAKVSGGVSLRLIVEMG